MSKSFEVEILPHNDIRVVDFLETDDYTNWNYYAYNGDMRFKKIPIKKFKSSSNLIKFLKDYSLENNIDINKYDIYYKKNTEWYSKLYFYLL